MLRNLSLFEREVCIRAKGGNGGRELDRPCAMIFNMFGFITTVSLTVIHTA